MIHYHGTPITPRPKLLQLAGRHFTVSWTYPLDVEVVHEIGQTVMLDNGAFTLWKRGTSRPDWHPYYGWCEPWLDHPTTWAVIPDVIDGTEEENDALLERWPFGYRGAPVWHLHESLERLDRLIRVWPMICLGSSGLYARVGTVSWHRRMEEVMDHACDLRGRPRTRLHMLRGLELHSGPYPFYSADSSMIAQKHAGRNNRPKAAEDVVRIANEVDGRQPAPMWRRPAEQLEMA